MATPSRDRGTNDNAKWPYPYGSDLHWFWGWAYRMEDWLNREDFAPSEYDSMIIRADRDAANAMLRYSIDFPALINEVKLSQKDVESRWEEALNNDNETTRFAYADAMDVLVAQIYKSCELISERETAQEAGTVSQDSPETPAGPEGDRATAPAPPKTPRTMPDGSPFTPLQQAILRALRGQALTKDALAGFVAGGDGSRLYKNGGLKELTDAGYVVNKPGVGYYRPDKPPIFEEDEEN